MSKVNKFEMNLLDEGDFIKTMFACDEVVFCDHENKESRPVRVRAPLPDKKRRIEMAKHWVEIDSRWESVEHWFNFIRESNDKEIFARVQEIRKSVKRINRLTLSKKISMEALDEYINTKK